MDGPPSVVNRTLAETGKIDKMRLRADFGGKRASSRARANN